MSKKSLVDSIEVKSPCSEDWSAMSGNEKVRFCSHCSKNVNDLSQMTRKQALRLMRDSGGNLCVRYVKNPVNNQPIFAEKLYQITRRAGLAAGVLGASLAFSTLTYAQGSPRLIEKDNSIQTQDQNEKNKNVSTTGNIEGTVTDSTGAVIQNVVVTLTNSETKVLRTTITNEDGFYAFQDVEAAIYDLSFRAIGFEQKIVNQVSVSESAKSNQSVTLGIDRSLLMMGDIMIVEYQNPLHQAVANDNFDEAKNLLTTGTNVNKKDENYNNITPLFLAVENGNVQIAELLLNFGAKINARDNNKQTPLMRLDSDASTELVRLLLGRGAKINAVDAEGNTPLISATQMYAKAEIVQILLESGATPNAQNKEGRTALMNAAESDDIESVRVLLSAGADVNLKNKEGKTAFDLTSIEEIKHLLEFYGIKMDNN